MKRLVVCVLVIGCTDAADSGELRSFANDGSGLAICDEASPWCAYDGLIQGSRIQLTSRPTGVQVLGTLSLFGLEQLELAVGVVPPGTPTESSTCDDAPRLELAIEYEAAGLRTFHYDCEPGRLAPLHDLVASVRDTLIACTANDYVSCK